MLNFVLSDLARAPRGGVRPPPLAASQTCVYDSCQGGQFSCQPSLGCSMWTPGSHVSRVEAPRKPAAKKKKKSFIWFTPYFSSFLTRKARPSLKNFRCTLVFVEYNSRVEDFRTKSHRGWKWQVFLNSGYRATEISDISSSSLTSWHAPSVWFGGRNPPPPPPHDGSGLEQTVSGNLPHCLKSGIARSCRSFSWH